MPPPPQALQGEKVNIAEQQQQQQQQQQQPSQGEDSEGGEETKGGGGGEGEGGREGGGVIQEAPVFYPTAEEFADPLSYIAKYVYLHVFYSPFLTAFPSNKWDIACLYSCLRVKRDGSLLVVSHHHHPSLPPPNRIRPIAEPAGICRIIPPEGWTPPFTIDPSTFKFPTRVQNLSRLGVS